MGTFLLLGSILAAAALDLATRVDPGIGPDGRPQWLVLNGVGTRPWQFITYAWVHSGWYHVGVNLAVLLPAAVLVEWRVGASTLALAYLVACVACGVGFHLLCRLDLLGASGAASAMIALAAVLWARARAARWARIGPAVVALAYAIVLDVGPWLMGRRVLSHRVHAIGFAAGIALGLWLTRRDESPVAAQ